MMTHEILLECRMQLNSQRAESLTVSSSGQLICWNLGVILRLMSSMDLRVPPPAKSHFKPRHWNYKHPERMRNTAQTKLGSFATLQQIVYYRDRFIWVFRNRNWTGRSAIRSEIRQSSLGPSTRWKTVFIKASSAVFTCDTGTVAVQHKQTLCRLKFEWLNEATLPPCGLVCMCCCDAIVWGLQVRTYLSKMVQSSQLDEFEKCTKCSEVMNFSNLFK